MIPYITSYIDSHIIEAYLLSSVTDVGHWNLELKAERFLKETDPYIPSRKKHYFIDQYELICTERNIEEGLVGPIRDVITLRAKYGEDVPSIGNLITTLIEDFNGSN